MRNKDTLIRDINEIKILLQYLYIDEDNCIKFENKSIGLNEWLQFKDLRENKLIDIAFEQLKSIINLLKIQTAEKFPNNFSTKWEEITSITNMNITLNK